ncbi:hypothetical protein KDD30_19000 (plasmid) [Photobacterium sp. GJ3]|uniref:beta-ketoacyl synthase N-terminal-like domain-containing protein n=1 Tax=Photobacterium sp. GJ3 TaxID=2829502 RepID=UPI001B8B39CE|nr:beta-ketoacyl synthase N-terminal-like domain-containing protein [Photobacterium sp. GJ3]QUJ70215.1 hypothetical protein KDD30_19000 [Photobacterium sp. GJ3]
MNYSFDAIVFKSPGSESPAKLGEALNEQAFAGQFGNYDEKKSLGKSRHLSAATRLLSSTALKLTEHEDIALSVNARPHQVGVYIACENINLEDDFEFDLCAKNYGPDYVSPLKAPNTLANAVGSHFARFVGIKGPNCTVSAGRLSVFQALDAAMMHLDNGSVEKAIVGAVEVVSPYHSRLSVPGREIAVASALRRGHLEDTVVFYPPIIRMAVNHEASIAQSVSELARRNLGGKPIDEIWVSGQRLLNQERLLQKLQDAGLHPHLIVFSEEHFDGECANGLLLAALAEEKLTEAASADDAQQRAIVILELDDHGQFSLLLMEGR